MTAAPPPYKNSPVLTRMATAIREHDEGCSGLDNALELLHLQHFSIQISRYPEPDPLPPHFHRIHPTFENVCVIPRRESIHKAVAPLILCECVRQSLASGALRHCLTTPYRDGVIPRREFIQKLGICCGFPFARE